MAWTAPMTAVANTAFTAAQFNQYVRDNLNETAPAKALAAGGFIVTSGVNTVVQRNVVSDTINTTQSTNSNAYTDLATVGPTADSVISGSRCVVWFTAQVNNTTSGQESIVSVEVSGATATAADDNYCLDMQQSSGTAYTDATLSRCVRLQVNAGTNTYRMKYRVTGSSTGNFRRRSIVAMPF